MQVPLVVAPDLIVVWVRARLVGLVAVGQALRVRSFAAAEVQLTQPCSPHLVWAQLEKFGLAVVQYL